MSAAFPVHPRINPGDPNEADWSGMSLRDWFAGQVIAAMASRDTYDPGQDTPEKRARLAYIEADAMLKSRATPPAEPRKGEE